MRSETLRLVLWPMLICFLAAAVAAQEVEVYADPAEAPPGSAIRIFGFVKPESRKTEVNLAFFLAGRKVSETIITAAANGEFEFFFDDTQQPGAWRVSAVRKGGRTKGEAEFLIRSAYFMAEMSSALRELNIDTAGEGTSSLASIVGGYPAFPGKDAILDELEAIQQEIAEASPLLDALDAAAGDLDAFASGAGDIPEEALSALREAAAGARTLRNRIRSQVPELRAVLEESRESAEWCYVWSAYHDFCTRLNDVNNFVGSSLADILQNLIVAEATQGMPFDKQQKIQTVVHLFSTGATGGPSVIGFVNYMTGTIAGLAASVYEQLLRNCTQYKGTLSGEYSARLLHGEEPFYFMSYTLNGEVDLVFQSRQPGDPSVHLKGRMEGRIDDVRCAVTMAPFQLPSATVPAWCRSAVPLLSGKSFQMAVEGTAADRTMELKITRVFRDFDLQSKGYYVVLSSHAPLPIPGMFTFPLMDAEWFITRATKLSQPDQKVFVLDIGEEGNASVATGAFEREFYFPETYGPNGRKGVRVELSLSFRVCSPPCQR